MRASIEWVKLERWGFKWRLSTFATDGIVRFTVESRARAFAVAGLVATHAGMEVLLHVRTDIVRGLQGAGCQRLKVFQPVHMTVTGVPLFVVPGGKLGAVVLALGHSRKRSKA